jgi:galactokinase
MRPERQPGLAVAAEFKRRFGSTPRLFRAPGRVNIIGEHTDYNLGFVLPVAISRFTYAAIHPRNDTRLRVASLNAPDAAEADLGSLAPHRHWSDYVFGVAQKLRDTGFCLHGADLLVSTEIPVGAGLSSSAAIEIASALALLSTADQRLSAEHLAALAQSAENEFVGMKCGIMDQSISILGREGFALLLDCRSLQGQLVALPEKYSVVICNTGVKHELAASEYNQRRSECEEGVRLLRRVLPGISSLRDVDSAALLTHAGLLPPAILRRCRHVVYENERVLDTRGALEHREMRRVSELLAASHASLRDDYEVSCPELDTMVAVAAAAPGFAGGRMTGGGFGGCTVNFVRSDQAEAFRQNVLAGYARRCPQRHGEAYVVDSANGGEEILT